MKLRALAFTLTLALAATAFGKSGVANYPHFVLENDDWKLLIPDPRSEDSYYQGTRFVASGMIAKAWWRGIPILIEHSLDKPQGHHDRAGGTAEEFDINGSQVMKATPVGGRFMKIGVGILKRDRDEPYRFWRNYPVITRPKVTVTQKSATSIAFDETLSDKSLGVGYRLEMEISLRGSEIVIKRTLTNLGEDPLFTEHYAHNFIRIGDERIASNVHLEWDGPMEITPRPESKEFLSASPGRFEFSKHPGEKDNYHGEAEVPDQFRGPVSVVSKDPKLRLDITSSQPLSRFAVWGTGDRICPELFTEHEIAPGKSVKWSSTMRVQEIK